MSALKKNLDDMFESIVDGLRHAGDGITMKVGHMRDHLDEALGRLKGLDADLARGVDGQADLNPRHEYGTRFFGADQLKYYEEPGRTLGAPGSAVFMMPSEDASGITNGIDAAIESGLAPSVTEAARLGERIFGAHIPVGHLPQRLPTIADAEGWEHFLPGGHTAVIIDGHVFPNATREFVVDGGSPLPAGTIVFELLDGGNIDIRGIVGA